MSNAPPRQDATPDQRTPVTVLTGFLGAGKTTFLNAILSDKSAQRIAVIVNEFGEVGLDHDLIEAFEGDIVLMQSGCLCCSIRGDLSKTIGALLTRRTMGDVQFDRIVIETTGLADPGPILQTLLVDPLLARNTRMDGVVTLVDAVNGPATLDTQFEAVSQVAMADLLVLSKHDLVTADRAARIETRLRALNQTAPIIRGTDGVATPDRLWGLSGLRHDTSLQHAVAWTTPQPDADPLSNLSGLATPAKPPPAAAAMHDARISSVSIALDAPLEDAVFDTWLDTLIALKGPDILRVKGIVFLKGMAAPFAFHGVQHVFDPPVPLKNWTGDDRRSRIVVIARDMDRPELQRSLDMLRAERVDLDQSDDPVEAAG
ncbi:GTP-binding protein [Thalassococcus sp. S3]|uniref:CobW family GTP-binding protein n=1 Tax=Thalassococcus sp. S3 TaxID=2017482 RepID=UPI0010243CA4|nr:GTP-binding protein [Thalassococcus sp. S3]QBF32648.1 GTP-binding protein [Thalassococcus sp. S3]